MSKNIIITGATGSLGEVVVQTIIEKPNWVCILPYRTEEKFNHLKSISGNPDRILGIQANITDEASVNNFFSRLESDVKQIHGLVHIAGGFWMGKDIADTSLDELNKMLEMNFISTFLFAKHAFKMMQENGGELIFIGAKPALEFVPKMGAYAVSKAALMALARQLANEGQPYGIGTTVIIPSIIDTPANREAMPDADFNMWVRRESIAEVIVQILSTENPDTNFREIRMFGRV